MIYLVFAAILWGSSFPVITYALREVSPMLLVVLRFGLAFLLLTIRFRTGLRDIFRRDVFLLSIPNALSFILQFRAQELTTASKTALFVNSSPIFVVMLSLLLFRSRLKRRQLVATAIAMAGVVVTSTGLDFSGLGVINRGDVLGVLVGLCWAVFIVSSGNAVNKYGALQLARGLYFWTAVMTLPLLLGEHVRFAWSATPAIVYMVVFTTIIAYACYLHGTRSVAPVATSIIILIEVVVAFGISHFFLGESFTAIETAGVAMVVAGVTLVLRR